MKKGKQIKTNFNHKTSKKSSHKRMNNTLKNHNDKIRLNKFISNTGICSRREADKFIEAGVVTVNGVGVTSMGYKINPNDIVKFNGQKIKKETLQYILLNKPKNYTLRNNKNTKTNSVFSLISNACKEEVFPVDKLGNADTGLLIFTNDYSLSKKIGSKHTVIKSIYQITLNKCLSKLDLDKIRAGIFINGQIKSFSSISYIKNKEKNQLGVEHHKGGAQYVKKIFEILNYKVTKIDRVFFGGLTKKTLLRKQYRHLSKNEINILKRL